MGANEKSEAAWHGGDKVNPVEAEQWRKIHAERDAAVREAAALRAGVEYMLGLDAGLHHQMNASPDYWQGARDAHEWWSAKMRALLAEHPTPDPS